jgi:hypothetical protein
MKYLTSLYRHSNKSILKRMYFTCNAPNYLLSPFMASVWVGTICTIIIKHYISKELLYIKLQNEEIIREIQLLKIENNTNL